MAVGFAEEAAISVYVWKSFCKFFTFDTQKLAPKNMHVDWHAQFRSWHLPVTCEGKKTTHVNRHARN